MNVIAERVKVTDKSGNPVDIGAALNTPVGPGGETDGEVLAETDADTAPETEADATEAAAAAEEADTKA
jgi:hypothetical protein